jgi:hypothetical protein
MAVDAGRDAPELSGPPPALRRALAAIGGWLCVVVGILSPCPSAQAQPANPFDSAGASDEPVLSLESPVGPIDYVPGRGLRLGRTGLTVGGFSTLEIDHEEGEPGFLELDGVNVLALWEPVDFFSAFAELEVGDLFSLDLDSGDVESEPSFVVERLYGDLGWNDALNGRLGKFQSPVGIWNLVPAEPFTWTATDPVLVETAFDEHQTGGAVFGSFYPASHTLDYWVYGQFFDPLDPSETPPQADHGVGGRLRYGSSLGDWAVGASYLSSRFDGRWNYLGGLDGFWQLGSLELQGEFAIVRGDIPDRNLWDVYIQGAYGLGDVCACLRSLHLVGRYEHFEPSKWSRTSNLGDVGVAWIPRSFLILKAGYRFADRQSEEVRRGFFASFSVLF